MAELLRHLLLLAAACCCLQHARAAASDEALDDRVMALSAELRCLVCQNQSLADSHASLAVDLRRQMREQLAAGRSEAQVTDWLVQRYGDYVHYRPPLDRRTWLLWAAPAALACAGAMALALQLRRRRRTDPAAFDPDERGATDDEHFR
jgi:cytochrome c-type biogenesis protein CcmH